VTAQADLNTMCPISKNAVLGDMLETIRDALVELSTASQLTDFAAFKAAADATAEALTSLADAGTYDLGASSDQVDLNKMCPIAASVPLGTMLETIRDALVEVQAGSQEANFAAMKAALDATATSLTSLADAGTYDIGASAKQVNLNKMCPISAGTSLGNMIETIRDALVEIQAATQAANEGAFKTAMASGVATSLALLADDGIYDLGAN